MVKFNDFKQRTKCGIYIKSSSIYSDEYNKISKLDLSKFFALYINKGGMLMEAIKNLKTMGII